jgi:hypothetical protein
VPDITPVEPSNSGYMSNIPFFFLYHRRRSESLVIVSPSKAFNDKLPSSCFWMLSRW